jgi:GNAT superfamily N-acetyltransferase
MPKAPRYGLEIRAATPADAPAVCELLATAGHTVPPATMAHRLEALRQSQATALIAVEWGPPSGLIALHWHRTLADDHPKAQIDALFVAPEDRRRGIARMLLKAAAQAARTAGCDDLTLFAQPDRLGLQAFAQATGFLPDGTAYTRPLRKKP